MLGKIFGWRVFKIEMYFYTMEDKVLWISPSPACGCIYGKMGTIEKNKNCIIYSSNIIPIRSVPFQPFISTVRARVACSACMVSTMPTSPHPHTLPATFHDPLPLHPHSLSQNCFSGGRGGWVTGSYIHFPFPRGSQDPDPSSSRTGFDGGDVGVVGAAGGRWGGGVGAGGGWGDGEWGDVGGEGVLLSPSSFDTSPDKGGEEGMDLRGKGER